MIWLCDDNGCHAAAKKVHAMPKEMLDAYEIGSALAAPENPQQRVTVLKIRIATWVLMHSVPKG